MSTVARARLGDLTTRAMLIRLRISKFGNRIQAKDEARMIEQSKHADAGTYSAAQKLFSGDLMKRWNKNESAAREFLREHTSPWLDDGSRIIVPIKYDFVTSKLIEFRDEADLAAEEAAENYEDAREEERLKQNGAFKESKYPTKREFKRRFGFGWHVFELPKGDLRVDLSDHELRRLREETEETLFEEIFERVQTDVRQRFYKRIVEFIERVKDYKPAANGVKASGVFRDTVTTNIEEVLDLIPVLNLFDDPAIEHLAREVKEKMCRYSPETLRLSEDRRSEVLENARELQEHLETFLG